MKSDVGGSRRPSSMEPCTSCGRKTRRRQRLDPVKGYVPNCFWCDIETLPGDRRRAAGIGPSLSLASVACPTCHAPEGVACQKDGFPFVCIERGKAVDFVADRIRENQRAEVLGG